MSAPGKSSRWGSLLSQAVAGVEARLDTILSEEEQSKQASKSSLSPAPAKPPSAPSRSASNSRTNDRLQERLARAVAAKQAHKAESSSTKPTPVTTPRQSVDVASRASSEDIEPASKSTSAQQSPRPSEDVPQRPSQEVQPSTPEPATGEEGDKEGTASTDVPTDETAPLDASILVTETPTATAEPTTNTPDTSPTQSQEERIKQLERELEEARLQQQEETHGYVEQIDALQAKLQYLSRETTDAARKAAQEAPSGSLEKKLAEKDQQIAQLMEEGKNLASTEQKLRTLIKGLRVKITEGEKEVNSVKSSRSKLETELDNLRKRSRRADDLEKYQEELHKRIGQSQKDIDALRSEVAARDKTISDLRSQLQKAKDDAKAVTAKINDEALEKERQRVKELEEDIAALQVEKNLITDRAKLRENELKEKAERAAERARVVEVEMKAELQIMESKLEAMRMRAEETSSGAIGDSQAKLLRQVETLQTQYSIASENWQGIEATLLARITNLEKERDEALQRESEMRKKAREAALRARRQEEELEETKTKLPTFQEDVKSYQVQLESLKKRAEEAEAALAAARADFEKQKASWKEEKAESRDQDRRGAWLEDLPGSTFKSNSRPASPLLSAPQRTLSSDLLGLASLSNKLRKHSATSSNGDPAERFSSRRPSAQPPSRPSIQATMSGLPSAGLFSPTSETVPTPSTNAADRDEAFEGVERSSSPHQIVQDMVSVSTVAAGPSVQLVERMSAAIRRLESEKVATREELARISNQRDEARAEIVTLMRELESNKAAARRLTELEAEVAEVNERYETTLELLGEKSELVEELRADVDDVKAMYRDLVERTVK
ncbi:Protein SGM1 [Pleurostoma richardsiae]|uniref:Protein SGM1 n=1 Tax=Pleurostoma richardsiae TaxID=41990 RepID=A0AA38RU15_9PEZI|nr:Protein SGM1 [Pleurostoma richardsiae]